MTLRRYYRKPMKDLMNEAEAAAYLGFSKTYMNSLRRMKKGPKYGKPTIRVVVYQKHDLDAWRASWLTVTPKRKI